MTANASLAACPASFSFLFDSAGEQVGVEGATLAHASVDRDVVYSVEVAEYLDGYRTVLAFLDDLGRVVFSHTMDRDGPLPELTEERARSEADLVIEHAAENAAARGEASTVLVDNASGWVWHVAKPGTSGIDAAKEIDGQNGAEPRRYYLADLEAGDDGYSVHLVPSVLAEDLEGQNARDTALVRLFGLQNEIHFTDADDRDEDDFEGRCDSMAGADLDRDYD
ncbi:hypothetical protein [Aureimonas sp. AU40]|uniref:hypothetical protein n=1 Tax=Aureimonas sp. AU40 TaxID=1637747 RepID=UPI0007841924|nr:hypothetical protein [Aureimonas sp. AU40]